MEILCTTLRASIRLLSEPSSLTVIRETLRQYPVLLRFALRELNAVLSPPAAVGQRANVPGGSDSGALLPSVSAVVAVFLVTGDEDSPVKIAQVWSP